MRSMLQLALVLGVLQTTTATADEPPPVPDGGLNHYYNEPCTDPVFGLDGTCFYSLDVKNNRYIAFYTEGNLCMYIMQNVDGVYVEMWRRAADV